MTCPVCDDTSPITSPTPATAGSCSAPPANHAAPAGFTPEQAMTFVVQLAMAASDPR